MWKRVDEGKQNSKKRAWFLGKGNTLMDVLCDTRRGLKHECIQQLHQALLLEVDSPTFLPNFNITLTAWTGLPLFLSQSSFLLLITCSFLLDTKKLRVERQYEVITWEISSFHLRTKIFSLKLLKQMEESGQIVNKKRWSWMDMKEMPSEEAIIQTNLLTDYTIFIPNEKWSRCCWSVIAVERERRCKESENEMMS